MKKLTISLCILGFVLTAKAQVGVKATNPRGDVETKGDRSTSGVGEVLQTKFSSINKMKLFFN